MSFALSIPACEIAQMWVGDFAHLSSILPSEWDWRDEREKNFGKLSLILKLFVIIDLNSSWRHQIWYSK